MAEPTVKEVHVAVAVIIRNGRVLIARRPDHVHQGGLLEFPGGKVEPEETVQQALVREIAEETGLRVPPESLWPVIGIRHDYGDKRVFLDVWETDRAEGEPEGREGQPIEWRSPSELSDRDFPAANRPVIRALRLPHRLALTGPVMDAESGLSELKAALARRSPELMILRAPDLDAEAYLGFAHQAMTVCGGKATDLLLHGAPELLRSIPGARGVHLPWREAERLSERPVPADAWLGVSCHNAEQLRHAERLGADYVLLGAVQPTESHPGRPALGWQAFAELVTQATVPVYGLGGLGLEDEEKARSLGAQGIAGIGFWWR
ncbi:Nudix family hydrolase [Marinobacter persicus]|uniref:8-oxo-dGTP diphosphatase n=1 Tax=Marinobacter persicus TaxID=930118 RepID=A0A2S6G7V0_9GAMM|nr:Nudix family hydrolase [Marinobacter persicus]KXS47474.1 MAG: mutator MutT protein [Marinobacter sp. T13-3]PPK52303.1 8-oxo-dGTPase [Marinobacter persicus]PPK55279.1 8-oxo-dGTPase [Marinobacter persicus]PPK59046.1 8-oxo-dGTPase [Marinobacter persicus]